MVFNALIPARSGSKRVPNKNIRDFCGKPLMVWSIEQALACEEINEVYVSSDSEEYFEIARKAGAKVIDRGEMDLNKEQSMDTVLKNAYHQMNPSHAIILLQPTSPLRLVEDIENAINTFIEYGNEFLVSVFDNDGRGDVLQNGSIYITTRDRNVVPFNDEDQTFYKMPKSRSFEIDTEEDWEICEIMMKEMLSCSNEKK